jgi:citrate lyase subunit beta/citryl-CoA lyase
MLYVRINALDTGLADADLDAIMPGAPAGIMLPKASGGADVQHLGAKLAVREAENGLVDGATRILPIATETGGALFGLGTYAGSSRRLAGLTWGAEDLAADLGAETNKTPDGAYTPPFALARSLLLFGAAAAAVDAIDTVFTAFRDAEGFRRECVAARRDGFVGKMAIHPDQVAIINEVFTPADAEIARAKAIVAAFAAAPDAGVLGVDGEMLDRPHLLRAERLLRRLPGHG